MGTYRLAKQLSPRGLVTDAWAGLSDDGRAVTVLRRKDPWAQGSAFLERFTTWQRGWSALREAEGVLPLFEVGLADGAVCVVQDFMESEPVRTALAGPAPPGKTPFSIVESLAIVIQAARGLRSLSQLNPPLMHGDVSASTLLLGADGTVRLEAIGVASAHPPDATQGPARSELLCLSPEELEGRAGPTTDVFRLGLVWLELLTGKPAFGANNHAEVKARFEKFPGVTAGHFPSLPPQVAAALAMMLSKAPTARPSMTDLASMLEQIGATLGLFDATRPLVDAFPRLFPGRAPTRSQLQGGTVITVGLPGASLTEGAVKLARITTRRVTADDVAAERAVEAVEAARVAGREWSLKHSRDEDNPKDFALGANLIELQRLTVEQVDAALRHAQSLGATLFDSLLALDTLDEDEVLPIAAGLLKQQYLTGPQMLELALGKPQAAMLPRDAADDWQVFPLKLEAGGLTVAVIDPARLDVLDDLKLRAKARSVTAVRATQRTIEEGFARVYDGKTSAPSWAVKGAPQVESFAAPVPPPPVPAPMSFELDVADAPPEPSPGRLALSASGVLEAISAPSPAAWAPPPSNPQPYAPQGYGPPPSNPQPYAQPGYGPPPSNPQPYAPQYAPQGPSPYGPPPSNPAQYAPQYAQQGYGPPPSNPQPYTQPGYGPPPSNPQPYAHQGYGPPPSNAPYAQPGYGPPPSNAPQYAQPGYGPPPSNPAQYAQPGYGPQAASAPQYAQPGYGPPPSNPALYAPPPSSPAQYAAQYAPPVPGPGDSATQSPGLYAPPPSSPAQYAAQASAVPQAPAAAPQAPAPSSPAPAPAPFTPPQQAPVAAAPAVPVVAPAASAAELTGSLDVALRLFDAALSVMGDRGLEASAMISLVRSVAKQAGATGGPMDQVRLSVTAVVIAALLEGKRAFEVPSRPAAAACLGPHWRDFEDFVRPLLDGDETLPSDPRGVVISLCFEVANTVGAVPRNLADATQTLDALRSRYPLAALAALEIVLAAQ